jgi:threonine synthase
MDTKSLYHGLINHQSFRAFDIHSINTFCPDEHEPLIAQYDLSKGLDKKILTGRPNNMWRYKEVLPIFDDQYVVNLGEGFTPILPLERLREKYGFRQLEMKDESGNPTGSFKARGLGMAVSKAKELGVKEFCIPTAGNAGSALSAYCAAAGLKAHIYMPRQTPQIFQLDCKIMGAEVTLVDGNISDAGVAMREANSHGQWFDVTTLKEPFRLEGKKTMGYEIAEQYNWQLPDVIIYPTGGGTGLIGIWKAFHEMMELGWIDHIPSRMVAVQTDGCDPIVQAHHAGLMASTPYKNPAVTIANGLRVPHAFGHKLILKALKESDGTAMSVSENDMLSAIQELSQNQGLFVSPEGAAVWHAAKELKSTGWIKSDDRVCILNTGSAYKYAENLYDLI